MPEDLSANLSMPLLMPSQAQKHVTHNEALLVLDALVQLTVANRDLAVPPSSPVNGDRHIVAPSAAALWGGPAHSIAVLVNGIWMFYAPRPGWQAYILAEERTVVWQNGGWQDVLASLNALDELGINATADSTNRLSVASTATLLSHVGNGHQLKINKAASTDTASLLFQSNWSGRAEMGLSGNNDFGIKVSQNGNAWAEALRFEAATGKGLFGFGLGVQGLITGTAVTQSSGDTTTGRLTKVGDFGLGGVTSGAVLAPSNNLNLVTVTGWTDIDAATLNKPGAIATGSCLTTVRSTNRAHQMAFNIQNSLNPLVMLRVQSGDGTVWSPWRSLYDQSNILGAVSQSAGVPTGAIIERGSNASGDFTRFADGTQICTHKLTAANILTASGSIFMSPAVDWVFPAEFSVSPVVSGVGGGALRWVGGVSISATTASLRAMSPVSESGSTDIEAMAVGRWY